MNNTAYAYAVARIRVNETKLLTATDIERLITADDYQSTLRVLEEKGWIDVEDHENVNLALSHQMQKTWKLLCEVSPDISELEFLIVKNDYHNIKAALKAFVSIQTLGADIKGSDNFIVPSSIDPAQIDNAVINKKYNEIPGFVRDAIRKTYEVLIHTADGQLADIILDVMALDITMEKAQKTKNEFIKDLAELICVTANIKIALRALRTGKDEQFLETALCQTHTLDKSSLVKAVLRGMDDFIGYIASTPYIEAAEHIKISNTSFEKWCDDTLIRHIQKAKYICLGVEPLIAYYIAKDTELKTIRIILACKYNKILSEVIKERVRKIYV